jgi:hypothetical protein
MPKFIRCIHKKNLEDFIYRQDTEYATLRHSKWIKRYYDIGTLQYRIYLCMGLLVSGS